MTRVARILRRLSRLTASGLCLLSLVACVGAGWLWWRSYRAAPGKEDHAGAFISRLGERYTVRSAYGRLTLYAPRRFPARAGNPAAADLVGSLADDQLVWEIVREWPDSHGDDAPSRRGVSFRPNASPRARPGTPAEALEIWFYRDWWDNPVGFFGPQRDYRQAARRVGPDRLEAPLLRALEEPRRALAAHVILTRISGPGDDPSGRDPFAAAPGGSFVQSVGGVRVALRPVEPFSATRNGYVQGRSCTASTDPAEIKAVLDRWHRRLDVPVGSVRHWQLVAAFALPPLLWSSVGLRRAWVRQRRKRLGLCLRCGYDLRESRGVCPECGTPLAQPQGATP